MKPDKIYHELKDLADRLDITVWEQNLKKTGFHVNSGLCRIRGKRVFVMDKHLPTPVKIKVLAQCLGQMPIEDMYVMPAIRKIIDREQYMEADEG